MFAMSHLLAEDPVLLVNKLAKYAKEIHTQYAVSPPEVFTVVAAAEISNTYTSLNAPYPDTDDSMHGFRERLRQERVNQLHDFDW
jgi:hypothetical protein